MPEISDLGIQTLDLKRRRPGPASKIAQLSTELRALLNQLLDHGKTYDEVVAEMAKHDISLNTDNVSKWFNGPYQDYLTSLEWRDELQQLRDHAFSFGQEQGSVRFQEGVVQIGLTQIFRAMKENHFKEDPANSLRLFNSLARLSREALVIRKYADQQAQQKAVELRKLDVHRKMNDAEEMAMQDRADDFFGWKSAARIKNDLQPGGLTESSRGSQSAETPGNSPAAMMHPEGMPESLPPSLAPPVVPIENPKSEIKNSEAIQNPNFQTPVANSNPQNSGCELADPAGDPAYGATEPASTCAATESDPDPQIKIQKSKIKIAEELCYDCGAPLPPLLPNGQRPAAACFSCGARLYPSGTTFDHCHCCQAAQPILPAGERVSLVCRRCNITLSPAGQRFVSHCPACGFELPPLTADGTRISDRCPDCRAPVPLLEPVPVSMNSPFPVPAYESQV